jgi:hypothetical protein
VKVRPPRLAAIIVFSTAALLTLPLRAQETLPEQNKMMIEAEPYWHGAVLLGIGAVLGFIGQVAFELFRSWRRPKQQMSYQVATESIIAGLSEEMRERVAVTYKGRSVDNLHKIECILRNVGRATIRDDEIRMRLGDSGQVLDFSCEDKLQLEYDGHVIDDHNENTGRSVYLKHFPIRGEIRFVFIAVGGKPRLAVSEIGPSDIDFKETSSRQLERDTDVLYRLVSIVLLWMFLPGLSNLIPIDFLSSPVSGVIHLGLLAALLPILKPSSRIIADLLLKQAGQGPTTHADAGAHATVVQIDGKDNVVHINSKGPTEGPPEPIERTTEIRADAPQYALEKMVTPAERDNPTAKA